MRLDNLWCFAEMLHQFMLPLFAHVMELKENPEFVDAELVAIQDILDPLDHSFLREPLKCRSGSFDIHVAFPCKGCHSGLWLRQKAFHNCFVIVAEFCNSAVTAYN